MVEVHADDIRFLDYNRPVDRNDETDRQAQEPSNKEARADVDEQPVDDNGVIASDEPNAIDYDHYLKGEEGTPIDMSEI